MTSTSEDRDRDAREVMANVSLVVEKAGREAKTLRDKYDEAQVRRAGLTLNSSSTDSQHEIENATSSSITSPEHIAAVLQGSRWRLRRKLGAIRVEPFRMPRARMRMTSTDDTKHGAYNQETQKQNAKLLRDVRKLYRAYASRMLSIASLNYGPSGREQEQE